MYAVLILVVAALLQLQLDSTTLQVREVAQMYQSRWKQMQVVQLAESLERFYVDTAVFPSDLSVLGAVSGYEYTKGLRDNWQGYGVSGTLQDGVWQFQRMVLVSHDPTAGVSPSDFMQSNACGVGGFNNAQSWCGDGSGKWYRRESRETYNGEIVTQRVQLNRVLQKFADYYSTTQYFPKVDAAGTPLAIGGNTKLAELVGYAGTSQNCTGVFNYEGVPIDCGDLFDRWGGAVGYQFVNEDRIVLTSETPIFNSAGTRVVVASEIDNTH